MVQGPRPGSPARDARRRRPDGRPPPPRSRAGPPPGDGRRRGRRPTAYRRRPAHDQPPEQRYLEARPPPASPMSPDRSGASTLGRSEGGALSPAPGCWFAGRVRGRNRGEGTRRAALSLIARADLRQRWRSWVVLGLLFGITFGVATAAVAGTRRTEDALPRLVAAAGTVHAAVLPNDPAFDAAQRDADRRASGGSRHVPVHGALRAPGARARERRGVAASHHPHRGQVHGRRDRRRPAARSAEGRRDRRQPEPRVVWADSRSARR